MFVYKFLAQLVASVLLVCLLFLVASAVCGVRC
jgi:hypothetical protein